MPFVNTDLHHDALFLFLMWFWVSLLNAAMAIIGPFLMKVIRRENSALKESEQRLSAFLSSANDLIFSFYPDGKLLYANKAWKQALGYDPAKDGNLNIRDIMDAEHRAKYLDEISKIVGGLKIDLLEGVFLGREGRKIAIRGESYLRNPRQRKSGYLGYLP